MERALGRIWYEENLVFNNNSPSEHLCKNFETVFFLLHHAI